MLSKELETVLNDAFRTARSRRHEFITVEHLLLALLEDAASLTVMTACSVDMMPYAETSLSLSIRRPLCWVMRRMVETPNRHWGFNEYFSAQCFTYRALERAKSQALIFW